MMKFFNKTYVRKLYIVNKLNEPFCFKKEKTKMKKNNHFGGKKN